VGHREQTVIKGRGKGGRAGCKWPTVIAGVN
jgi:hypothetical protein